MRAGVWQVQGLHAISGFALGRAAGGTSGIPRCASGGSAVLLQCRCMRRQQRTGLARFRHRFPWRSSRLRRRALRRLRGWRWV